MKLTKRTFLKTVTGTVGGAALGSTDVVASGNSVQSSDTIDAADGWNDIGTDHLTVRYRDGYRSDAETVLRYYRDIEAYASRELSSEVETEIETVVNVQPPSDWGRGENSLVRETIHQCSVHSNTDTSGHRQILMQFETVFSSGASCAYGDNRNKPKPIGLSGAGQSRGQVVGENSGLTTRSLPVRPDWYSTAKRTDTIENGDTFLV